MGERFPIGLQRTSANDLFKARWGARVHWSTIAAVGIHAAILVFWPTWHRSPPPSPPPVELIQLTQPGWSLPEAAAPVDGQPAGGASGAALSEKGVAEPDNLALAALDELRDRLRLRGAPRPMITEPDAERPLAEPAAATDPASPPRATRSRDPAAVDYRFPLELSALDLERLSAILPEVVVGDGVPWALIRNPAEVERFMARVYERRQVDPAAAGSVGVTIWVDENGTVGWAEIVESSGRPDVDEVALALFNEVVAFRPARAHGTRVSVSMTVWLRFPWY